MTHHHGRAMIRRVLRALRHPWRSFQAIVDDAIGVGAGDDRL